MEKKIEHLTDRNSFGIQCDNEWAVAEYKISGTTFDIIHTYVPKSFEGQGIASRLVEAAFTFAKEKGYRLQGSCKYAEIWLLRHANFLV